MFRALQASRCCIRVLVFGVCECRKRCWSVHHWSVSPSFRFGWLGLLENLARARCPKIQGLRDSCVQNRSYILTGAFVRCADRPAPHWVQKTSRDQASSTHIQALRPLNEKLAPGHTHRLRDILLDTGVFEISSGLVQPARNVTLSKELRSRFAGRQFLALTLSSSCGATACFLKSFDPMGGSPASILFVS